MRYMNLFVSQNEDQALLRFLNFHSEHHFDQFNATFHFVCNVFDFRDFSGLILFIFLPPLIFLILSSTVNQNETSKRHSYFDVSFHAMKKDEHQTHAEKQKKMNFHAEDTQSYSMDWVKIVDSNLNL